MVKPPARDPSDSSLAENAEAALFVPEKAKYTRTVKRVTHLSPFALLEVGLAGGVVGVRGTLDFNVSLDGGATGVVQPNLTGLPLVVTRVAEEGPVTTTMQRKILLFAPACGLVRVPASGPLP